MSKNLKIIIAVALIAVVAVGGYFLTKDEPFQEADAFDMMKNYYKESINITSMDEDVTFSISIDSQDPNIASFQEILNELEFQMNIKEVLEPLAVQMDLEVMYQGEESLSLNMFIDDEKRVCDVPFVYDRAFYMTYEDYNEFMENQGLSGEGIEGIEGIENLDFEKYENIMRENLDGILIKGDKVDLILNKNEEDTIECQELLLTFNDKQALDFLIPLFKEAKDDEAMKNLIIAKAEIYVDFMKSFYSDDFYETAGIENPYAEIDEAITEIESNYSQGLEDAIVELEKIKAEEHQYFTTINKIGIDKNGMMRYWNMDLTLYPEKIPEDEYGVDIAKITFNMETVVNSVNEDVQFRDYSKIAEEGENLSPIINNFESQESQALMMQIYGKLMQEVGSNPLFQRIAEEAGVY